MRPNPVVSHLCLCSHSPPSLAGISHTFNSSCCTCAVCCTGSTCNLFFRITLKSSKMSQRFPQNALILAFSFPHVCPPHKTCIIFWFERACVRFHAFMYVPSPLKLELAVFLLHKFKKTSKHFFKREKQTFIL